MIGGAWGGGGAFGAPGGRAAAPGLPFGGIPSELQAGVDKLLAGERRRRSPIWSSRKSSGRRSDGASACGAS